MITAIFSILAGYFFRNFRHKASIIIQRYRVPRWLFADYKMYDLECLFDVKFCFRTSSYSVKD